ncbi:MAG: DUF4404 family protein [Steroidobacteraceae bacterium]|nr:DUF4404 family protein [Steroidobacteraceae bacterium]
MTSESLQSLLRRLHEELGKAGPVDDETRRLLDVVAGDIAGKAAAEPAGESRHAPALEKLAVRFETDHPALAAATRQVLDALAKAGI